LVDLTNLVTDLSRSWIALAFVYAVAAIGLNLQWGHTGLFNAGIAGFFAIGAYVAAIVSTQSLGPGPGGPGHAGLIALFAFPFGVQIAFVVGGLAAMVVCGLIGLLIAIPTLRLRADYLAIATLALSAIAVESIRNWDSVTGGVYGILGVPRPLEFGQDIWRTELAYALTVGLIVLIVFVLMERATRAPWGRTLKAVREDEDAALALGKNTYFLKLQAFVFGAALMGGAGALFATLLRVAVPDSFTPALTFTIWTIVIVGGSGNNKGVILGAVALTFLEYFTVRAKDWFTLTSYWSIRIFYVRLMALGILLILLILFRPAGLLPEPLKATKKPRILIGSG